MSTYTQAISDIKISFLEAQALDALYSPLNTNETLYQNLKKIVSTTGINTLLETFPREIFTHLLYSYYPNETAIKAAFSQQFFFQSKNHVVIYELNASSSRVDMCKINGNSIAYEIKTELDNFKRLPKQLNDYSKLFDKIYLICPKSRLDDALKYLPDHAGIYLYKKNSRNNYCFTLYRKALANQSLDTRMQLMCLEKSTLQQYCSTSSANKEEMVEQILQKYNGMTINKLFKQSIKTNTPKTGHLSMRTGKQYSHWTINGFFKTKWLRSLFIIKLRSHNFIYTCISDEYTVPYICDSMLPMISFFLNFGE